MKQNLRGLAFIIAIIVTLLSILATSAQTSPPQTSSTQTAMEKPTDHSRARVYDYSELLKAPEKARGRRNPLDDDPTAAIGGKKLFEQHCAECHGDTGVGGKAPDLRVEEVQSATPGTLFWILSNGVVRRGMPVWSKLPEPQRWQLVAYIKSLKTSVGQAETKTTDAPPPTGPLTNK